MKKHKKPQQQVQLRVARAVALFISILLLSESTTASEGLVGLTRRLMYAGGERLVVSLWQVSDEGTSVLMQEFYKEMLQNGKSPNIALRAAQLKMWQQEKWRNPNY